MPHESAFRDSETFCYLFLSFIIDGTIDSNIEEKGYLQS